MSEQSFAWPNGARAGFSLTFDDGRFSQVDLGLPILNRHACKATFFVRGDHGRVPERLDGWKAAVSRGHEIGNHLVSHPCSGNFAWIGPKGSALENYTLDQIEEEIISSNATINSLLGITPVSFAYPCGLDFVGRGTDRQSYVPLIAKHFLVGRGYRGEFMNNPAFCDLAMVQSVGVDAYTFEEMTDVIEKALRLGYWLIFTAHNIIEGAGEDGRGMTEQNLNKLCEYLAERKNDIWTDTCGHVAEYIQTNRPAL